MARAGVGQGKGAGWSVRPVTRKRGARRVKPMGYRLVALPQTPQEEIDVCLACPLPDCQREGCALEGRPGAKG
ncbi:MAG: hypothetical protein MUC34_04785 [Anaerolineae bacterium]|jgi:hypothetical protein|nr:hypothetical protein [Anaerolineae bacterium]